MTPPDHLIERAAALLQPGAQAPSPPVDRDGTVVQPALAHQGFVPLPPTNAALVRPATAPAPTAPPFPVGNPVPGAVPDAAPALEGPALASPASVGPSQEAESISTDTLQAGGMVVARAGRSRISEEYRIVLGRVLRALREEPDNAASLSNVMMVTSAKPGEGKSFTSLNLAGSVAQHTADKVLLVDLDAKVKPLSALLDADKGQGFYDLVADPSLDPRSVVRMTALPNLKFMPVGRRAGNTEMRVDVHPITAVITRIARMYPNHVVILDAPPCLSTSDPSTVAPIVAQIVMVIEAERTQRSEVEAALDLVRACPNITMLLNKVQLTTNHTFGAYDYYGNYA